MKLEFPLQIYFDDDFRENYLKGKNIEEEKNISEELTPEEIMKLDKMLKEFEIDGMDAQDILDSIGGRKR